ncbi:MAG: FAD-binding oxidoreductase [Acidimicrobiales bacterium]
MTAGLLTGWGRTAATGADVVRPLGVRELEGCFDDAPDRGVIARGLGRSYGDAAQNAGGRVVDTTLVDDVAWFDPEAGRIRVAAGASLDGLMRALVPRGWFVPVTPGTKFVTVGGAVASDIHGKNHHRYGSWCDHVSELTLLTPADGPLRAGPDRDPDLFWATAGGMGLTGVMVDATVNLTPIETSRLVVDTDRTADLDDVMALMESGDADYPFSVAWIDLVATGASIGRSGLTRGRFARREELDSRAASLPLAFAPRAVAAVPPVVPPRLLNRSSIRAFNEVWYRKAPVHRREELQSITRFFHPLDLVQDWNRLYGRPGFLQWQFAVPLAAGETLRRIVETLSGVACPSFLSVLKRFGPANPGPISFPGPGWTLALDLPTVVDGLGPLLDRLDEEVVDAGGRVYLAKDSRLRPELLGAMYPRLDEWRKVRDRVDPTGVLRSDLSRRLGLA